MINNPEQKTFYVYDERQGFYMGTGNSSTTPSSSTFISPEPIPNGKIPYFKNGKWIYRNIICAVTTDNGLFERTVELPDASASESCLVDELPPVADSQYYWNKKASKWEYKPRPKNIYVPKFYNGEWMETGEPKDVNRLVDKETSDMIKRWCDRAGFNEEQLICKGIEDKNDPDYITYKNAKSQIIAAQKSKKHH